MLVDSHCHLSSSEIYNQIDSVIERAKNAGVCYFLNAGSRFDELATQREISERFPFIYTATGVHPHDAKDFCDIKAEDVLKNTSYPCVVAIGECGLDYFYDFSPRDVQIKVFKEMIKASQESGLPIIVHTREADVDTMTLLSDAYQKKPFSGVIHSYSSGPELAKEALNIGFYISASGMITFKNASQLRNHFEQIELHRLLVETDTPYLAPVPMRGKTNEPSFVVHTAQVLADIKQVDFSYISQVTTDNFFKLFQKAKKL